MSGKSVIFGAAGNVIFVSSSIVTFPTVTKSMKDIKTGRDIFPSLFPSMLVA